MANINNTNTHIHTIHTREEGRRTLSTRHVGREWTHFRHYQEINMNELPYSNMEMMAGASGGGDRLCLHDEIDILHLVIQLGLF